MPLLPVIGIGDAVVFEALGIGGAGCVKDFEGAGDAPCAAEPKIEPLIELGVFVVPNVEPNVGGGFGADDFDVAAVEVLTTMP